MIYILEQTQECINCDVYVSTKNIHSETHIFIFAAKQSWSRIYFCSTNWHIIESLHEYAQIPCTKCQHACKLWKSNCLKSNLYCEQFKRWSRVSSQMKRAAYLFNLCRYVPALSALTEHRQLWVGNMIQHKVCQTPPRLQHHILIISRERERERCGSCGERQHVIPPLSSSWST